MARPSHYDFRLRSRLQFKSSELGEVGSQHQPPQLVQALAQAQPQARPQAQARPQVAVDQTVDQAPAQVQAPFPVLLPQP